METFCFSELFGFLQAVLGMVFAYLGGRQSTKVSKKSRPFGKANGSDANID